MSRPRPPVHDPADASDARTGQRRQHDSAAYTLTAGVQPASLATARRNADVATGGDGTEADGSRADNRTGRFLALLAEEITTELLLCIRLASFWVRPPPLPGPLNPVPEVWAADIL